MIQQRRSHVPKIGDVRISPSLLHSLASSLLPALPPPSTLSFPLSVPLSLDLPLSFARSLLHFSYSGATLLEASWGSLGRREPGRQTVSVHSAMKKYASDEWT